MWLFGLRAILIEIRNNTRNIMVSLADIKTAEDKIGSDITTAVAQNTANLKKIQEGLNNGVSDEDLQALLDEANAHAAQLEAAFPPATGATVIPNPPTPSTTG